MPNSLLLAQCNLLMASSNRELALTTFFSTTIEQSLSAFNGSWKREYAYQAAVLLKGQLWVLPCKGVQERALLRQIIHDTQRSCLQFLQLQGWQKATIDFSRAGKQQSIFNSLAGVTRRVEGGYLRWDTSEEAYLRLRDIADKGRCCLAFRQPAQKRGAGRSLAL